VRVSKSEQSFGMLKDTSEVTGRFEGFIGLIEDLYGVDLPHPNFRGDLSELKKFCTGLVECHSDHPWKAIVSSLSARSRAGIAHSLFLFRKVIPQEKPNEVLYVRRMAQAQAPPARDFLNFARNLTRRIFRPGWDVKFYGGYCTSSVLSTSSCSETSRKDGGCRGLEVQSRWLRSEFCSYVITGATRLQRCASRIGVIESGGKWRTVSIPPRVDAGLRPLHSSMYSHLSRFKWLLRGDAKADKFKSFSRVAGEIFVSGDYESATDNLNSVLQCAILDELLDNSFLVPEGVKSHARSLYETPLLSCKEGTFVQRRGQLMGNLTSFPLLCLVNYITFRYSTRFVDPLRRIPVRINGDDIVFRTTPTVARQWESDVAKGGLVLSIGKTMKNSRFFTLNSALFEGLSNKSRAVGFVRPRSCWSAGSASEQVFSLRSRYYAFSSGMGGKRTSVAREFFIAQNERTVHLSRRSLSRGLEMKVDQGLLRRRGLWHRELYYLEQDVEQPLPLLEKGGVPEGFVQVSASRVSVDMATEGRNRFNAALYAQCWNEPYDPKSSSEDVRLAAVREGCSPYGINHIKGLAKIRQMLRLSRNKLWKWVFLRSNESVFGRVRWSRPKRVWVSLDMLSGLRQHVDFVKAIV